MGTLAAGQVNSNNIGIPLSLYLLGSAAYPAPVILLQLLVFTPITMAIFEAVTTGQRRPFPILRRTLTNPIVVGSVRRRRKIEKQRRIHIKRIRRSMREPKAEVTQDTKSMPALRRSAPDSGTEYGRPQALTWNIGTTGSTVSEARTFRPLGMAEA